MGTILVGSYTCASPIIVVPVTFFTMNKQRTIIIRRISESALACYIFASTIYPNKRTDITSNFGLYRIMEFT